MRTFFFLFIFITLTHLNAQENAFQQVELFNEIYQYTEEKLGADQLLINGNYHEYVYKYKEGHPFLFKNEYSVNDILFHNTEYTNVSTKYDIYEQSLILKCRPGNSDISIILTSEFLEEFTIQDMYFKKYNFDGQTPAFYQVLANTEEITCLYYWYKTREKSRQNAGYNSFKYSKERHKSYLLINNNLLQYKNNKSFILLFPEHIQKELALYLKSNKLRLKKVSDNEMLEIIKYSNTLLNQQKTQ